MDKDAIQPGSNQHTGSTAERPGDPILAPGRSFGNFRVVKCLSSGLLANYYHMQHARDLRDVTVCIFHHRTATDPKCLERLRTLQDTLQGLDHHGIPKIRECVEIEGHNCILADLVQGQSLSQYISAHGKPGEQGIGQEETTRILAALLGLLGCAHTHGLDHRDLDTDQVFVQDDGSLQVLGLGIKAALGVELFESIVSSSVSPLVSREVPGRLNSFDVMSPEYRGGVPEDFRVDVHAAGCIGYWLLTGKKVSASDGWTLALSDDGFSGAWDELLGKMLERDREHRYQSCKIALMQLKEMQQEPKSERASSIQRQIDRIPIPQRILRRGEFATRIYRLLVIGLVGLSLTALVASFLHVTYLEGPEYTKRVAMVAEDGVAANLQLNLQPLATKVSFRGHPSSFVATRGRLALSVRSGEYALRVTAPNCIERVIPVSIRKGELLELDVDLSPAWAKLEVQSTPGAAVFVVDQHNVETELGVTNDAGVFELEQGLVAGTYQIGVRKQGYVAVTLENQQVTSKQVTQLEVPLQALPSRVTVHTRPAGARVMLDEVDIGQSPMTFELPEAIGDYLLAVHLNGYRSMGRRLRVEAGDARLVDFGDLSPLSGELSFNVVFDQVDARESAVLMEQLEVELDGVRLPFGASALKAVKVGAHSVRLLHPLYESKEKIVHVADRVEKVLNYQMTALPGRIEVVVPVGLTPKVRLNRQDVKQVDGVVLVPANQLVDFELQIQDHLTMLRRFEMQPNERLVWEVAPVPISGPVPEQEWAVPYQGLQLAWVGAGGYQMGSPMSESGRLPNEGPQTTVRFSRGFWIAAYEVTQAQYYRIMTQNPSSMVGDLLPVESVTWGDAQRYCKMLNDLEGAAGRLPDGYVYRLPTEAEWEYAARAGTTSPFAFGDYADAFKGNFRGGYPVDARVTGSRGPDHYGPLPVGSYEPNAFRLYDIHGNVAEWTADYYNGRLAGGSLLDPPPRGEGRRIAVRGGSWEDLATRVRCAARDEVRAGTKSNAIGFRVVLAPAL
jgi:formylglycine-generating enzyme required for sulfatase activity/serine/threonine protein kinase